MNIFALKLLDKYKDHKFCENLILLSIKIDFHELNLYQSDSLVFITNLIIKTFPECNITLYPLSI